MKNLNRESGPPAHHIMVDIETLGTAPGSVILSIGAVRFGPITGEIDRMFYVNIDRDSCLRAGLAVDPSTVAWWADQSDDAKAALLIDPQPLPEALLAFAKWWRESDGCYFWAQGPDFDGVLLTAAFRAVGLLPPWHFSACRDTRTVYHLSGSYPVRDGLVHHNALHDAQAQAACVAAGLRSLQVVIRPNELLPEPA